jgi:D-glycerate 3-kinase
MTSAAEVLQAAIRQRLESGAGRLFVAGICGAQGSGKSTVAEALKQRFEAEGRRVAVLSLDDLYRTRAEREALAALVHPLLLTRGVPGTHDVALGLETIAALERGEAAALPRFDKAADDRLSQCDWPLAPEGTELLILEGWCVGARPQDEAALAEPVNALEREEDPQAIWRRFANAALAGDYQRLFARIDLLALLAAPSFDCVFGWRRQQEDALRARSGSGMSGAQLLRFVQHYERLTRHILREMPARADLVLELGEDRSVRRASAR